MKTTDVMDKSQQGPSDHGGVTPTRQRARKAALARYEEAIDWIFGGNVVAALDFAAKQG